MTQIKKTLSIAGIIALATAPAMAEIASTDYVQSIVNNMIPKTGTVGHVLKKTATGLEWAAAPSVPENVLVNAADLIDTPGLLAIGLNAHVNGDGPDDGSVAIGSDSDADGGSLAVGNGAKADWYSVSVGGGSHAEEESVAVGNDAKSATFGVAVGNGAKSSTNSIAIGFQADTTAGGSIAIGDQARAHRGIQLGDGTNSVGGLKVEDIQLLDAYGRIPAGRFSEQTYDDDSGESYDNNGTAGQLLQTNGDGTMSWVDATASVLPALIDDCKVSGQRCALITTWNSTTNKPEYTWEVVKVNQ